MSYVFDTALLFTLGWCVQKRSGQAESHTTKKSLSTVYRSHSAVRSTAANKALVTAPNKPFRSTNLRTACSHGECVDAKASHSLTTCPDGGRNCPRAPTTIPLRNCSITNSKRHPRVRSRWFTCCRQTHALLLRRVLQTVPFALVRWKPPVDDEVAETLLEIP